jgi:DmsE family decaheme c-type cytochrome
MHTDGPRAQTAGVAARGMRPRRQSCSTLIVGALVFCIIAFASQKTGAKAAGQANDPARTDVAGSVACASCHKEFVKAFADNPHVKMAESHGKSGVTCENCHGAGTAHAESADPSKIFNPAKGTAKEVEARCLECHQGEHSNFAPSGHGEANVSCVSCHSVHAGKGPEHLLRVVQPMLCFGCHADVKPQFSMAFHHQVEEGRMQCTDCHGPHGSIGRKGLKSAAQQDAVCVRCHSEKAGPFEYEHDVVKTEGCTACHFPHGGPNPRLLNRASVNTICLQCHFPSTNSATASMPMNVAHNPAAKDQPCTMCHADIHGSHKDAHFFKTSM